jgi:hypothetical protein
MLRYLHGLEYDIDHAEKKIVHHVKYMHENDFWEVDESRIPNFINSNILIVYKEDIYQRPISYLRVCRFVPSDYEFEETLQYLFWNAADIRNAFRPHVDSHLAIYDVKGISRK